VGEGGLHEEAAIDSRRSRLILHPGGFSDALDCPALAHHYAATGAAPCPESFPSPNKNSYSYINKIPVDIGIVPGCRGRDSDEILGLSNGSFV